MTNKKNIVGFLLIFLMIYYCGCIEIQSFDITENNENAIPDSDGDGYNDSIDLYPNNPEKWGQFHNSDPVAVVIGPIYQEGLKYPWFFYGNESYDPDGEIVSYYWEFCDPNDTPEPEGGGDGLTLYVGKCNSTRSFINPNLSPPFEYDIMLRVTDDKGKTDTTYYTGYYDG